MNLAVRMDAKEIVITVALRLAEAIVQMTVQVRGALHIAMELAVPFALKELVLLIAGHQLVRQDVKMSAMMVVKKLVPLPVKTRLAQMIVTITVDRVPVELHVQNLPVLRSVLYSVRKVVQRIAVPFVRLHAQVLVPILVRMMQVGPDLLGPI